MADSWTVSLLLSSCNQTPKRNSHVLYISHGITVSTAVKICMSHGTAVICVYNNSNAIIKKLFQMVIFFSFSSLAEQAPISCHIHVHLTTLVTAYEDHSHKWPAPVMDTFFMSQKCLLTYLPTAFETIESYM